MTLMDLFERDEVALLDVGRAPSDAMQKRIAAVARELVAADSKLRRIDELRSATARRRQELATKILPGLMDEAGADSVGYTGAAADVIVETRYHANIKADWPDDQREQAFDHLEALGGGSMIKATVEVAFPRNQLPSAKKLLDATKKWLASHGQPPDSATLSLGVAWNTLTKWFEDMVHNPPDDHAPTNTPRLNPTLIGATSWRECKVVPRKPAKQKRGGKR